MTASEVREVGAADGATLRYEVAGTGAPIVFLPGSFVGRDTFARQQPAFAPAYQVILRDLRGHNGTPARIPPGYALDTTELDDLERVLDAEGIARAHIAGHSTGGAIAFAFARRRPERVRSVVLLEASLFNLLQGEEHTRLHADLGALKAQAEAGDPAGAARGVFTYILGKGWETRAPQALVDALEASAPMCAAHIQGLLDLSVTLDDVRSLKPPALFLYGRRSIYAYNGIFDRVGEIHPAARRHRYENAGHALYVQRADEVNAAIQEFLAG